MSWMDWLGLASNILGVAGVAFALAAWLRTRRLAADLAAERRRQGQRIRVVLVLSSDGRQRELPLALRRSELTRAEVLGRLGMLPMREVGRRFSLGYLADPEFLLRLDEAQRGDGAAVLVIPCSQQEFDQFA